MTYTESLPVGALTFEAPGPGSWALDAVHFPRPATRYWAEMHPEPMRRGTREFMQYYGILLEGLDYAYINGFAYTTRTPISDEEFPARAQRSHELFEGRLWRDQLRDWDDTFKPVSIRT